MPHLLEYYSASVTSGMDVVHVRAMNEKAQHQSMDSPAQPITIQAQKHMDGITYVELALDGKYGSEKGEGLDNAMDGVEYKSRPPSPPDSGTSTPSLRIPPCPLRMRLLIPPPNYGATNNGSVFRSAFPQDRNLEFLKSLGIRTMLCLVETEPSEAYSRWISSNDIKRHRIAIAPNKDGKVKTTWDSLCEALLIVMDSAHYPLYIHCNQGRHRTGCLIGCLRKIQRWPIEDVITEYQAYANPKARPGDIDLIRAFDPEAVFEYAKLHGRFEHRAVMNRMDSAIANIDALADALSGKPPYCDDIDMSTASNASTYSDDSLEVTLPVHDAGPRPDQQAPRPSLQRTVSQQPTAGISSDAELNGEMSNPEIVDTENARALHPSLHDAEATTSVVELSDDLLTPPLEASVKMLGAA